MIITALFLTPIVMYLIYALCNFIGWIIECKGMYDKYDVFEHSHFISGASFLTSSTMMFILVFYILKILQGGVL